MIDSGTLLQERFLIEEKIGMGGMGAVYRAIDQKFGSVVAIKRTFYGDAELAKAFEREARLLNGLHHPILPHVSDYFSENGDHFLVMEYIEGEDLSDLLKRGERFTVNTVLGWTLDLLDGLDYLHSQDPPVVHRDIKPHNMKLTSRGKIVLLDFGMAKETSSNTLATKSVFGYSRRYSPFEQIEGTGTDERSDIFSLGASVYHLLTGDPPVDVLRRVSAIVAGKPDPLVPASSVNVNIPTAVSEILTTALALNAENRFESARAMWNALEYTINAGAVEQNNETAAVADREFETDLGSGTGGFPGAAIPAMQINDAQTFVDDDETTPVRTTRVDNQATAAGAPVLSGVGLESQSLKRTLRRAIPGSISQVRVRRLPSNVRSSRWLPLLAACLAIAVLAIYLGFRSGDESESNAALKTSEQQEIVPATESAKEIEEGTTVETASKEDNLTRDSRDQTSGRVAARPSPDARTKAESSDSLSGVARQTQPTIQEPRTANRRTSTERPRRVTKPAFEQPAVSSIEAIMTGVPEEGRNRWEDRRDQWMTDEELRRRQIRRVMRENRRRQQPF